MLTGLFVAAEDGTARLRWVTLGRSRDGEVEGLTGLRFARFPLGEDGRRWIYRLVTTSAGEDELAELVTRDSMIGVGVVRTPQ